MRFCSRSTTTTPSSCAASRADPLLARRSGGSAGCDRCGRRRSRRRCCARWRTADPGEPAREIERRVVRAATPGGLTGALACAADPPRARRASRRRSSAASASAPGAAATLVRLCRSLDLERPCGRCRRPRRPRGSSASAASGPGRSASSASRASAATSAGSRRPRPRQALLAELRGRRVEPGETDELLEPYGEWAGLASVYLLAGYAPRPRAGTARRAA